jgi:hypothetical protein
MKTPVHCGFRAASFCVVLAALGAIPFPVAAAEETSATESKPKLLPASPEELAARQKQLAEAAPEGAKLLAYLDCGSQWESSAPGNAEAPVKIVCTDAKPHRFANEVEDVPATQARIFFSEGDIVFDVVGLDPRKQYRAGITWWDYDNGGRTQSILATSPSRRMVRFAVPCIRLPDYEASGRLPGERQFSLPATFMRDGKMQLIIQRLAGANTVISEVWIWELP